MTSTLVNSMKDAQARSNGKNRKGQQDMQDDAARKKLLDAIADGIQEAKNADQPRKKFTDVQVIRHDSASQAQISLPSGMPYDEATKWMESYARRAQGEEQMVNIYHEVPGYPLDAVVALKSLLDEIYGYTEVKGEMTWFGERPPVMVGVQVNLNETIQVPWGKIAPVGLGGVINIAAGQSNGQPCMKLQFSIKKKNEWISGHLVELVKQRLQANSIYRGKAVMVDLEWMRKDEGFDPVGHAPKFFDVSDIEKTDLIVSPKVEFALNTSVMIRLERRRKCVERGIPIKHGMLLSGYYGTGKTLTSKLIAKTATDNGWTVFYLKSAKDFEVATRLAKLYAPAVLFVEDIDRVTSGKRTESMDRIFNVFDGIDTKGAELITVLTTNNPEAIHSGFLRAGRVDSYVFLDKPTVEEIGRLVQRFAVDQSGRSILNKQDDFTPAYEALVGLTPAYIAEVVYKASLAGMHRGGELEGDDLVTCKDLTAAALTAHEHARIAEAAGKIEKNSKPSKEEKEENDEDDDS